MNASPTTRRLAALGLLCALILFVVAGIVLPLVGLYSSSAVYGSELRARLAQLTLLAANDAALKGQLQRVRRSDPAGGYFLTGSTPSLALAKLQQMVKQLAERNGGELVSTQNVTAEDKQTGPIPVSMKVHVRGDVRTLLDLLYALESGRPMLFLDNIIVTANPAGQSLTESGPGARVLDIRFDLLGYLRRVQS
jgi:general secretion pathway protein M